MLCWQETLVEHRPIFIWRSNAFDRPFDGIKSYNCVNAKKRIPFGGRPFCIHSNPIYKYSAEECLQNLNPPLEKRRFSLKIFGSKGF